MGGPSFDIQSLLQMLGLGGGAQAAPPAPQSSQIANLAGAAGQFPGGLPGAQQMNATNPPPQGAGLAQSLQDPMLLAAQLGATQSGSPDAAALQAQLAQAQKAQQSKAMYMGLLQGGLGMAGARDPLGRPANPFTAASQGLQQGVSADQQQLQNARQTSQSLLGAQQAGQGMQLGAYELQTKAKLQQMYGLSDPQAIAWTMAMKSGQSLQAMAAKSATDPSLTPEQQARAKAFAAMAPSMLGTMGGEKVVAGIYGPALNASTAARNASTTNLNNARAALAPGLAASTEAKNTSVGAANSAYANTVKATTGTFDEARKMTDSEIANMRGKVLVNVAGAGDIDYSKLLKINQEYIKSGTENAPPLSKFKPGEIKYITSPEGERSLWQRVGDTMVPMVPAGSAPTASPESPTLPPAPPGAPGETGGAPDGTY